MSPARAELSALRLCFVGDSIVTGVGDIAWQGWPVRLCAVERANGHDLTPYNLGVRGDTSEHIRSRWFAECAARLAPPWTGGIVFAFGVNDICYRAGERRVALRRSIENARDIIGAAAAWRPTLWIGPACVDPGRQPCRVITNGIAHDFSNGHIEELSTAFEALACSLGVPYLDLYGALLVEAEWTGALSRGDGVHPGGLGYVRLAEVIGQWPAWRSWLTSDLAERVQSPLVT
jgi:lysophospholipase L1-like esterase